MARKATYLLFRSSLFRDVLANILARAGAEVRAWPVAEASGLASTEGADDIAVVLEVNEGEDRLSELVCEYLLSKGARRVAVYAVDLRRDEIVEYRRRRYRDIGLLKKLSGGSQQPEE